jgi:hypothetical protein
MVADPVQNEPRFSKVPEVYHMSMRHGYTLLMLYECPLVKLGLGGSAGHSSCVGRWTSLYCWISRLRVSVPGCKRLVMSEPDCNKARPDGSSLHLVEPHGMC